MRDGPVVIGFDGTPPSESVVREAARLLHPRKALVVTVWNPGLGYELAALPTGLEVQTAPIDYSTAHEIDKGQQRHAQQVAQRGAELAREAGCDAEGLAVAEETEITIAETLVRVATEHDAAAMVVGAHNRNRIGELFVGSTSRDVIRHAPCPVVVVRDDDAQER